MITEIIPDHSTKYAKFGRANRTRLLAWEPSKKKAIQIVENNVMDIREDCYEYAVIEKIGPGVWVQCKEELWYKWNDEENKYLSIDKPYSISGIVNFGIG